MDHSSTPRWTAGDIPAASVWRDLLAAVRTSAVGAADPASRASAVKAQRALVRLSAMETHGAAIAESFAVARSDIESRLDALVIGPARAAAGPNGPAGLAILLREVVEQDSLTDPEVVETILRDVLELDLAARLELEGRVAELAAAAGPAADWALNEESWSTYLRRRFPDERYGAIRSVCELTGGISKRTFLVEMIDDHVRSLPRQYVVRMDTGNFDTTVATEYPLLERIWKAGVPVPEPLWLETSAAHFGHPFLVMKRLQGLTVGSLFDGVGDRAAEPDGAAALAEGLALLHTTPLEALVDAPPADAREAVIAMLAELLTTWRGTALASSVPVEAAFAVLRDRLHLIDGPAALVHGECGPQNVLVEDGRLRGLIDWEYAHVGDPAEDLAYCRPAVERMMGWGDFLARYRCHGGQAVSEERLRFLEVLCQLRNAVLAARIRHDYVRGRVEGVNLLVTSIDTLDRIELQLAQRLKALVAMSRPIRGGVAT